MIKMAVLAPKGIFEDEDIYVSVYAPEESVRVRLCDDFARDCDEAV